LRKECKEGKIATP
jgi:hypothetical protein